MIWLNPNIARLESIEGNLFIPTSLMHSFTGKLKYKHYIDVTALFLLSKLVNLEQNDSKVVHVRGFLKGTEL